MNSAREQLGLAEAQGAIRLMDRTPNIDVEARTIEAQIMTRNVASDGGIILPDGINIKWYEENPVVLARHSDAETPRPTGIGRSLGLSVNARGMTAITKFADTELAREWAYLYGVNPEKEVYMRAWSFGWRTLEVDFWDLEQAKRWVGSEWDDDLIMPWVREFNEVWVATRSLMNEYSPVEIGADRTALSRAHKKNIPLAGRLMARIDLSGAAEELREAKQQIEMYEPRIAKLERDLLALQSDGAAAALRGDTAELIESIRDMRKELKGEKR